MPSAYECVARVQGMSKVLVKIYSIVTLDPRTLVNSEQAQHPVLEHFRQHVQTRNEQKFIRIM